MGLTHAQEFFKKAWIFMDKQPGPSSTHVFWGGPGPQVTHASWAPGRISTSRLAASARRPRIVPPTTDGDHDEAVYYL